jgi:glycopeptide antibiotics resistance protein
MLTQIHPPDQRIRRPVLWALTSGIAGLVANVLLVLFYLLARPFSEVQNGFGWLGTANDWVIPVQFLAMIPVALALDRWLPRTRLVRVTTVMAVGAMLAVAVLQLMLVAGVVEFDVEVLLVVPAFLLVYLWVFIVSSTGHRQATLPRSVTRFGLLLGASFPGALLITAAGYLIGSGFGHPLAFAIPGIVLGAMSWLAFPAWPLALARLVFSTGAPLPSVEKGVR